MGDHCAFFYGTLIAPEILYRVIYGTSSISNSPTKSYLASNLSILPALLPDFSRRKVKGADYPGIVAQMAHSVKGTYVSGLTDGDMHRLDLFEGDEYVKEWVEVEVEVDGKRESRKCRTYVYVAGEERLEAKEWDYEEFRKEKLTRWTSSSEEYKDVDNAF